MDSSPSKGKPNIRPARYPKSSEYEMYENEMLTKQRDITKKKVQYRKGPSADGQFLPSTQFQIPESDKTRYLTTPDSFGKTFKESDKQFPGLARPEDSTSARLKHSNDTNRFDINRFLNLPRDASKYQNPQTRNNGSEMQQNQNVEREQITNQVNYIQNSMYTNNPNNNKPDTDVTDSTRFEINKNSSLICKPINYDGEPVVVNNEVIKNKLILSCRPKSYYGVKSYFKKPHSIESERDPKYLCSPPDISIVDDLKIHRSSDIEYKKKKFEHPPYTGTGNSMLVRSNAFDVGSLGMGEQLSETEKQGEKYEEQYRTVQCKRYTRTFKVFLWALFIINILLVLIGLSLLLLTLTHFLFRDYINVVVDGTGYVPWIYGAMALSLLIIVVGVYGITTSITRIRKMLILYCIIAAVTALLIVIFLLIFWILSSNLRTSQQKAMSSTFNVYRCHRRVKSGWDFLQEQYQCCGVEARGDWRYIPPSCCRAETKFQKLECINHFIKEEHAFKGGCRAKLEEYFKTVFLLISCLLVLAFILLLLGILAALRLLKMYKIIVQCQEIYLITP